MKIDTSLQAQTLLQTRPENARNIASSSFGEQLTTQETASGNTGRVSGWADRTSFSSTSLSVSAALERNKTSQERGSSSSVVSSQAKPYLSADEVSFFEKLMRKNPSSYNNTGGYGQSAANIGGKLSITA